jgi:hypothetical protein
METLHMIYPSTRYFDVWAVDEVSPVEPSRKQSR